MTGPTPPPLKPDALARFDAIAQAMQARKPALFLDYDGTLVPLAQRPGLAVASPQLRAAVAQLAERMPVAVVSGRGRADVTQMLDVGGITYAGSHGFDIRDAEGRDLSGTIGDPYLPALEQAAQALAAALTPIEGAFVEDKLYAIAIHYREAAPDTHRVIGDIVTAEAARHAGLKQTGGKMIHELRPAIAWDKGTAVMRVMEALGLTTETSIPIFIGDDETDEDAFKAIAATGIGIRVGADHAATHAHYRLNTPEDVHGFLERLASLPTP